MSFVGRIYVDKMFNREMVVYEQDKIGVWIVPVVDYDHEDPDGSPYVIDEFRDGVSVGRFVRIDHWLNHHGISNVSENFDISPTVTDAETDTLDTDTAVTETTATSSESDTDTESDPLSFSL